MLATTPRQIDTKLADLYNQANAAEDRLDRIASHVLGLAGAHYYYRGRRRVTDMVLEDAEVIVAAEIAKLAAHRAAHPHVSGRWVGYVGIIPPYNEDSAKRAIEDLATTRAQLASLREQYAALEDSYTGWSRFFLVTSSNGHIHSSMHCSTCRPTTRFGWLPQLSGKDEATAVAECGPALCSVCFPSAPTDWTAGSITAAQAARRAAEAAEALEDEAPVAEFVVEVTRKPRGSNVRVSVGTVDGSWACRNEDTGAILFTDTKAQRDQAARNPGVWS